MNDAPSGPRRDPLALCPVNVSCFLEGPEEESLRRSLRDRGPRVCAVDPDPDHNRTVLSLLGTPGGLQRALDHLFAWALERIDLRSHAGVHPRVGAVDVVPFIPLRGLSMEACIQLARRVGRSVAEAHGMPVYLYGHAAVEEWRSRVPTLRRGGPEGLESRMGTGRDWAPDYGPPRLHPRGGASLVGARDPLVAWNVNLVEDDLDAARRVARAVQESSGGLPGVQAIGVPLPTRGTCQVAMNVLRMDAGVLGQVFERVGDECAAQGLTVASSEVIGLVPERTLPEGGARALRMENWAPERTVESQVRAWDEVRGAESPQG